MKPTDVNDSMFPVHKVLYNDGEFSIAWGTWDKGNKCLGMRWNQSHTEIGFPMGKGGRPIWLVIPQNLSLPIVTALLGGAPADNSALLQVLQELLTAPATISEKA